MMRSTLALLFLSAFGLSLCLAFAPVGPAPVGGGAVIEMHKRLFAALDRGDVMGAAGVVSDGDAAVSLVVLGADGAYRRAQGSEEMKKLLGVMAEERKKLGGKFETKILVTQAECPSEQLSWGAFELETQRAVGEKTTSTRYTMTSIARSTKDGMRLVHGQLAAITDAKH
jgi:hypothetical protein